jgi:hypothetical protein
MKKPVLNKPVVNKGSAYSDFNRNMLEIPADISNEIESKGLEARWINLKRFTEEGFHRRGWAPFKPEKVSEANGFFFGNNPDGYIRRAELVLACRPKELGDSHRADLRHKADRLKASVDVEYRRSMKESGFKTKLYEESDE